ncbi:MAG TPA: DUF6443 domain-containing protein [Pedobacter sp.]|uniref:DUF6443 domain-containing protein n=1 Tax=Pedobacter sp. TaxID=1411316 RepID=UPI002BE3BDE2|nr:DUF6443 domain-containing protein [Pedobacter sp.]HMI02276.1 DUF6443 domain-containing protein [Pedobacter sp.]
MKKVISLAALLVTIWVSAQSADQNYISTVTYKIATVSTIADPAPEEAAMEVKYYDGLGRPIQNVSYKQAADGKSIITPMAYDEFGREQKQYLPFRNDNVADFDPDAIDKVQSYYSDGDPALTGNPYFDVTGNAYIQKEFENSPLNRIMKQAAPGDDWAMGNGHEIRFEYQTNAQDEVRNFYVTLELTPYGIYKPVLNSDGFYAAHTLYKTVTKDENWHGHDDHTTMEFKDKEGRVILKCTFEDNQRHETYYVYDKFGNLSFVIPPLVDSANVTTEALGGICYEYRYDFRNRLAEKKLPGKELEYIFYDMLDRPTVTGPVYDPFGDMTMGWLYTKYDLLGRICFTGWYSDNSYQEDINTMRTFYDNPVNIDHAVRDNTTMIGSVAVGYRFGSLPPHFELLTINYYDDYAFPHGPLVLTDVQNQAVQANAKGLVTGSWTRMITVESEAAAEEGYTFYDKKSRPVLNYTTEHLHGFNEVQTKYDFAGQVLYTKTSHKKTNGAGTLFTIQDSLSYTPQGRLLKHMQKANNKPWELLSYNTYDNLGGLISKKVGGTDISTFTGLQKVDFRYNVRGWLTDINDRRNLADEIPDLFAFHINYNLPDSETYPVEALYNGNISETYWRSGSDNILRSYGFEYDAMNRLKNAVYQKPGSTPCVGNYDEYLEYDKNGNIQALHRTGNSDTVTTVEPIDDLTYTYATDKPNQLLKVTDATNSPKGFTDDSDGTNDTVDDYVYDLFGNMRTDQNKNISSISYNHLNLPIEIVIDGNKKITYIYDAAGRKLQKAVWDGTATVKTDYLSGFQYKGEKLQFFPTTEGYVNYTNDPLVDPDAAFNYVYNYTDHLGNIRLSYSNDPAENVLKILEENHYYPFGLKHENYSSDVKHYAKEEMEPLGIKPVPPSTNADYQYKYNGKEWQGELGLNMYDMDMRDYDPAIARWVVLDPVVHHDVSPYIAYNNNPVFWADPSGADSEDSFGRTSNSNGRYIPVSEREEVGEATTNKQEKRKKKKNQEQKKKVKVHTEEEKEEFIERVKYEQLMLRQGFEVTWDDNIFLSLGHQVTWAMPTAEWSAILSFFGKSSEIVTTLHGAERIAGIGAASRGGVLSSEGIRTTMTLGRQIKQLDGATVFLREITPGRFNAVVQGEKGIITTMANWSQKSINRIAKNYGWKL